VSMAEPGNTVREPAREIPVLAETDVVVCGGGPAGVGAALAAARNGARVMLVENQICLGGMATSGLMNRLGPYHDQRDTIVGGIPLEVVSRLVDMGAARRPEPCPRDQPDRYWVPFDPEALKVLLDDLAEEAGVELLLGGRAAGVVADADDLKGIFIEGKAGRQAILARVVIDATGDGDVAALAGAPCVMGREGDGLTQPISLMSKAHNHDLAATKAYIGEHLDRLLGEAAAEGAPSRIAAGTDNLLRDDESYFNVNHVFGSDATDPRQLTRAAVAARRQVWRNLQFLRRHVPGCAQAYLAATASLLGVRESRRVLGDYVLTGEDVLEARQFPDQIARYACWIDIHTVDPDSKPGPLAGKGPAPGTSYGIPYRCLLPKRIDNLLVAGRCLSATHEGLASARMMPCCMAMGQAAGTAAALCVEEAVAPRALDTERVRTRLRAQGAVL